MPFRQRRHRRRGHNRAERERGHQAQPDDLKSLHLASCSLYSDLIDRPEELFFKVKTPGSEPAAPSARSDGRELCLQGSTYSRAPHTTRSVSDSACMTSIDDSQRTPPAASNRAVERRFRVSSTVPRRFRSAVDLIGRRRGALLQSQT